MTHLTKLHSAQRILISTAERMGDILFCNPGIHLLKQTLPHAQIDVLIFDAKMVEIMQYNPDINSIVIAHKPRWQRVIKPFHMRKITNNYDVIINLAFEFSKYLSHLPTPILQIHEPNRNHHRTQQVINFIQSLLTPEKTINSTYRIFPQINHQNKIETLLQNYEINLQRDILIGCQLGCHRVANRKWQIWSKTRHQHKKVWPMENYIKLATLLHQTYPQIKFVLTGSSDERYLAKKFCKQVPWAIDLIGKTSILETAALMDKLAAYITHDTGTLHIASARQTPIIGLFGPTQPEFTGPFPLREDHTILKKETMADISVNEVMDLLMKQIKKRPPHPIREQSDQASY